MIRKNDTIEGIPLEYTDCGELSHHRALWPSVAALIPGVQRMRILDAGCGNGFLSGRLADLGHEITAIDISESGISKVRKARPGIRAEVRSVHESLDDLVPDGGFDLVFSSEVIEHLYTPRDFLMNLARTLRPGGWIILTTPYHGYLKNLAISLVGGWDRHLTAHWEGGHIKFFSQITLSTMLVNAGFADLKFLNAGRVPFFWNSIVCRATRVDPGQTGDRLSS
jgi:2-polyprenyl-6-hydroxyphenyl methylase/3-demethylubiquinone-9 3-methyltransferase